MIKIIIITIILALNNSNDKKCQLTTAKFLKESIAYETAEIYNEKYYAKNDNRFDIVRYNGRQILFNKLGINSDFDTMIFHKAKNIEKYIVSFHNENCTLGYLVFEKEMWDKLYNYLEIKKERA